MCGQLTSPGKATVDKRSITDQNGDPHPRYFYHLTCLCYPYTINQSNCSTFIQSCLKIISTPTLLPSNVGSIIIMPILLWIWIYLQFNSSYVSTQLLTVQFSRHKQTHLQIVCLCLWYTIGCTYLRLVWISSQSFELQFENRIDPQP